MRANGSVLFADIVSFTVFSGTVSALELVEILNQMFVYFDTLAEKHGVDKIKTLGE
jgi:class 3 adenylate cyclase